MHPTIFTIPWFGLPIRAYGLMLMIGFLGGVWWAAKRAERVKADPDLVINLGFVALIASVIGARAFYVLHYWEQFAGRGIKAIIDISAGGMEFYGGFIGAMIAIIGYLLIKRASIRLYLDILAPTLAFGMGMTRIGCFLNGCCWGAACDPNLPWAVTFPYASSASYRQWEERVITYPAELLMFYDYSAVGPIRRDTIDEVRKHPEPMNAYMQARTDYVTAKTRSADAATLNNLKAQFEAASKAWLDSSKSKAWVFILQDKEYGISPAELLKRVDSPESRTHAVHPAQLYASINGFMLAILLNAVFYRRKQHGFVAALFFLLYPIVRFFEEIIRSDNPHDVIGLTISQFVSLGIFAIGVAAMIAIYRMPANSMPANAKPATVPASRGGKGGQNDKGSQHRKNDRPRKH